MRLRIGSTVKTVFFALLMPGVIAFMDWRYFFPLSNRPDLAFQLKGEAIEVSAIAGILISVHFGFAKSRSSQSELSDLGKLLGGAAFAAICIALGWREIFPQPQFVLAAGLDNLGLSLFMGFFIATFGLSSQRILRKPSKEEEKSVV